MDLVLRLVLAGVPYHLHLLETLVCFALLGVDMLGSATLRVGLDNLAIHRESCIRRNLAEVWLGWKTEREVGLLRHHMDLETVHDMFVASGRRWRMVLGWLNVAVRMIEAHPHQVC